MSDDTMTPCAVCGLCGHWESSHGGELERLREEVERLRPLEAKVAEQDALLAETKHAYGGMSIVRYCVRCRNPYPEWSVSSNMTCRDCEQAHLKAHATTLQAQLLLPTCDDSPGGELSILGDVARELQRARELGWGLPRSMHEAYAVLLEEVDELWDHVRVKQSKRDLAAMRKEAVEVAAMAVKLVESLDAGRGRE